jgi:hypothetical protein
MRPLVFAAVGVVVGVLIGAYPASTRIRTLEDRVIELSDRPCDSGGFAGAVTGMLQGAARPAPVAIDDTDVPDDAPPDGVQVKVGGPPAAAEPPEDPAVALAAAKEALELRRAQARAALVEQTDIDDAQLAQIDAAAATMNDELMSLTEDFAEDVRTNGPPSRRDAMVYANEALNTLITAEDQMNGALTEDQRGMVDDETLDPTSYLDPALIERLQQLKLEGDQRNQQE